MAPVGRGTLSAPSADAGETTDSPRRPQANGATRRAQASWLLAPGSWPPALPHDAATRCILCPAARIAGV